MKQTLSIVGCTLLVLLVLVFLAPTWAGTMPLPTGPRPTPTAMPLPPNAPPRPEPTGDEPSVKPDLIVENITTDPLYPLVNVTCTIKVWIKNNSSASLWYTNNFWCDVYVNPYTTDLKGVPGDVQIPVQAFYMGAWQSYLITASWCFTDTAAYNLWAQVDTPTPPQLPIGNVNESNEDNNIMGPVYATAITNYRVAFKDYMHWMQGMGNTLDVVPFAGTVGVVTNTPGLSLTGDSVLRLGLFEEPPYDWGDSASTDDYNAKWPDLRLNDVITNDQKNPVITSFNFPFHPMYLVYRDCQVAVWEDGRDGPILGRDIYMTWSSDAGATWAPAWKVNFDPGHTQQERPSVALAPNGDVMVVWQDRRNGSNFDIYVQQYHITPGAPYTIAPVGGNVHVDNDATGKDQFYPDIAADDNSVFYVAWQDQRNGNDDIYVTKTYTDGGGLHWDDDTLITDEPSRSKQALPSINAVKALIITGFDYVINDLVEPPELEITTIYSYEQYVPVVTWEDWREGDADIYIVHSMDEGETFGIDKRINRDKNPDQYLTNGIGQYTPAIVGTLGTKEITFIVLTPYGPLKDSESVPVSYIHVVWQDYRNSDEFLPSGEGDDADIYYGRFVLRPSEENVNDYYLEFEAEEKVNRYDTYDWRGGAPVWQGEPDIDGYEFPVQREWNWRVYIVWADDRNYGGDETNTDIYLQLLSSWNLPPELELNNQMLNDGTRLHNFVPKNNPFYQVDNPPPARQRRPSITVRPFLFVDGMTYVVWDDDRIADPFVDRDVYFARSELHRGNHLVPFSASPGVPGDGYCWGSGSYISPIIDTKTYSGTWYIIDWHAVTDDGTYVTLQTRLGNTITSVLESEWYPQNYPYPDVPGVSVGAALQGYDAPGQHIVDDAGERFPTTRYIQYRVNMWAHWVPGPCTGTVNSPIVYDVILHYNKPVYVYLPLAFKSYW